MMEKLILTEDILEKYPKSIEKFAAFLKSKIQEDVPSNTMLELAQSVVLLDPRKLYDFFDDNGIIITITYHEDLKKFSYHNSIDKISSMVDSRIIAEKLSFENAFICLEKTLN